MKKLFFLLFLSLPMMLVYSCAKEDESNTTSEWKEAGYFYSIGDPTIHWTYPSAGNAEIIKFKSDNVFYSSKNPLLNRYRFDTASARPSLLLYEAGKTDTTRWALSNVSRDSFEAWFNCIEGCGKKFVRITK